MSITNSQKQSAREKPPSRLPPDARLTKAQKRRKQTAIFASIPSTKLDIVELHKRVKAIEKHLELPTPKRKQDNDGGVYDIITEEEDDE
jgi:hypothetical protein